MSNVKNISIRDHKINLNKTPYAACSDLIPDMTDHTISFDIVDSCCEIANGLYRCLTNEIPVKYLTVSMDDIFCTDPNVDKFVIRNRLEMIPIDQSTSLDESFSIRVENTTDQVINIYTNEMKQRGSKAKCASGSILLLSMDAGYGIVVDNITVSETYGFLNSRASIGCLGYEIIDHDMTTNSNILSDPTSFHLFFRAPGNMNLKKLVILAIDTICARLKAIDLDNSSEEFNVFKLRIPNENHTIGFLLDKYIYRQDPNIEFVAKRDDHPSKRACTIDIKHSQAKQLCAKAIAAIIAEYESMRKSFQ